MINYYLFKRFNRIDLRFLRKQNKRCYDVTKVKIAKLIKEFT
jgi:hypothetical protein